MPDPGAGRNGPLRVTRRCVVSYRWRPEGVETDEPCPECETGHLVVMRQDRETGHTPVACDTCRYES